MLQGDSTQSSDSADPSSFILYVEGPADRSILREWSYRLLPTEAKGLFETTVILGGRQPARAIRHFREEATQRPNLRALCVLDRDDAAEEYPGTCPNLEFFTWSRRHIESYLLVPEAMRRVLFGDDSSGRIDRLMRELLPEPGDEPHHSTLDAKKLLGRKGPFARSLGRPLPLARIARATREHELHPDVHALFSRLRDGLGIVEPVTVAR